ncbi:MAG: hypothetical protein NC253_05295 [Ruminococcus sp.]|nr:hypothetical protein [Ruminococcus sp.]MCM1380332.1 hypothetical protein [Muribaculaceae bacterium]MCM1478244.1 hypothetical protein [Muribaculaceae bacterium]
MSLLDETMEKCVMLDKTTVPDGYGSTTSVYVEGAEFMAAVVFDSSTQAKIAAVQGVQNLYTVITKKSMAFDYHDVFKRLSDGKTFRITSDGNDNKTPKSAGLDMRSTSAEEWKPPDPYAKAVENG